MVEMADRKSLDVVQFDAETVFDPGVVVPDGAIRGDSYVRRRDYSAVRPGMIMFADMCLHREYTVSPCLAMIRRDLLNREGIFFPEGVVHEDVAFMARVLFAADRVAHCPSRFYRRFVHAGSTMTGRLRVENLRGCLAALRQYRIAGSGPNLPRRVRRALWHEIVRCKWQIRRIADRLDITESSASEPLESWERVMLAQAFSRPFLERLTDAFHCLQDNGLAYTVKRIVGGRRQ